jgi:hypothetical protein
MLIMKCIDLYVHKIDLLDVGYEIYSRIMYHHVPYDQILNVNYEIY